MVKIPLNQSMNTGYYKKILNKKVNISLFFCKFSYPQPRNLIVIIIIMYIFSS